MGYSSTDHGGSARIDKRVHGLVIKGGQYYKSPIEWLDDK